MEEEEEDTTKVDMEEEAITTGQEVVEVDMEEETVIKAAINTKGKLVGTFSGS